VAEAEDLAPSAVAAGAGRLDVTLTLQAEVVIRVQPLRGATSFDGGFAIQVRDERGVPVFDQLRHGHHARSFGARFPIRLAPGVYTIELSAKGFHGRPVRFSAARDLAIPVEMVETREDEQAR
jgi:hypothetical protein